MFRPLSRGLFHVGTFIALGLASTFPAHAANDPVAPLSFAIGQATRKAVEDGLKGRTKLRNDGINRFSNGPMLTATGANLGIEDLTEVLFIFDPKGILVALRMTLRKGPMDGNFDRTYKHLAAKYPVVSRDVPFVGNKAARFRHGNVLIDLESQHLSFVLTVSYMTTDFEATYAAERRKDAEQQKQRERGQF